MSGRRPLLVLLPIAVALGVLVSLQGADAADILKNGGFEQWSGSEPVGWSPSTAVSQVAAPAVSGFAVRLESEGVIKQTVAAAPSATYTASAQTAPVSGSGVARLSVRFLDAGFVPTTISPVGDTTSLDSALPAFKPLLVVATAPAGTAWIEFVLETTNVGFKAVFDSASLDETLGPTPTPVPTNEPLPTAIPTDTPVPPTPGPTSPGGSQPGGPSPRASPTARPTSTPRPPTRAPTTRAPTQAAAVRSPTAIRVGSVSPVRPEPNSDAGGLLANGDFERTDNGQPSFWRKFGGSMFSVTTFYRGARGGLLLSGTTSTKWLYQDSVVEPGQWYEGRAWAQIPSGEGAAFIRIAWYATSDASGRRIAAVDSNESTSHSWTELHTGPVQAPAGAHSVRFRLMLRPRGPSSAVFDAASLLEVDEPDTPLSARTAPDEDEEGADVPTGIRLPHLSHDGGQSSARSQSEPVLRISEIMPDPAEPGADGAFEWVEIVNLGDAPVDVAGWQVGDARELDTLPAVFVPPGGSVVVAGRSASLPAQVGVVRIADGRIGTGLNNAGDTVRLVAPDGTTADAVSFGADASVSGPAPPAPGAGRSLRRDFAAGTWAVAVLPDPGQASADSPAPAAPGTGNGAVDPDDAPGEGEGTLRPPVVTVSPGSSNAPYYVLGALAGAGALGLAGLLRRRLRRPDGG